MSEHISPKPRRRNPRNWSFDASPGVFEAAGIPAKPAAFVGCDSLAVSETFERMHSWWLRNRDGLDKPRSEKEGDVACKRIIVCDVELISRYQWHSEFCLLRGIVILLPDNLRTFVESIFYDSKADVHTVEIAETTTYSQACSIGSHIESFLLSTVRVHSGIGLHCDGREIERFPGRVCDSFDRE